MTKLRICGVAAIVFANVAHASIESIGPYGIDSNGLVDAAGNALTGAGVAIGQVETGRPGVPGHDAAIDVNDFVTPTEVYVRTDLADVGDNITPHAVQVAGVLISTATAMPLLPTTPRGVAPGASLYSGADNGTPPDFDPETAITAQNLATVADVRATNISLVNPLIGFAVPDGNQLLTQFVDWSASAHDVLYVTAMRNDTSPADHTVPSDNFNGMAIAASAKMGDFYLQVAEFNDFSLDASGDRTSVSLIAPGEDITVTSRGNDNDDVISGTSLATPHVTGTVALLQQYANQRIGVGDALFDDERSRHHETMKAVLMNSADKLEDAGDGLRLGMTRTVLDQGDGTWLDSNAYTDDTIPLDIQMGAGHLNARRALQQFSPGEYDPNGAAVPMVAWDYDATIEQDDINIYALSAPLAAEQFVSITLAWDREVLFDTDGGTTDAYDIGDTFIEDLPFNDLDLYLMPASSIDISQYAARSIAGGTTVEHIFFEIETPGSYEIWVRQFASAAGLGQDYALAWWTQAIAAVVQGDYDGNGSVGEEDYTEWKADYGDTVTPGTQSDGNSDGIVDAADYTYWRNRFAGGAGGGGTAQVPEPAGSALMLLLGAILLHTYRDHRSRLSGMP